MLTDAQYKNIQQKIKAGTATPEEIQAIKEHDAAMEKKPEQDWWDDPNSTAAEDVIAKYNGLTSDDIAAQRLTKEQQGIQSKGNPGDNAPANPNALNSAEIDRLHKEELASAQTPDNPNPDTFSPDSSIREEAEAKKSPEVEAVTSVAQPKEGDTKKEIKAKGKYNQSMMSIWDAYHNGLIDKETAGYFTIDAIATLAKNLGRSMGNVAAQFSGGTIDNGHDESKWEQRQDKMFNTELQAESEEVQTFDNKFKELSYNRQSTLNDLLEAVKGDAEKLSDDNPLKIAYLSLAASIANGEVSGETTLAATGAKGITELFDFFKGKDK